MNRNHDNLGRFSNTKIYVNGKRDYSVSFGITLKRIWHLILRTGAISLAVYCIYTMGQRGINPIAATVQADSYIKVIDVSIPPVLQRIARAESVTGHYKNGQVVTNINKNGTLDVGKYQINVQVWGKKATELGYNIYEEQDNEDMAMWIYNNYGTEPWYSSKANW